MTPTDSSFADLSDDQLLAAVKRLAATERRATASLIRSLMELDARRLYLGEGCSSLFAYCTQVLHLAEGAAYNRIEAARTARRFPLIIDALEDGSLTLTAVRLLAPHLTAENHRGVLASARYKRKADIERLVASLNPKPAVPAVIRKLPEPRRVATDASTMALLMPDEQVPKIVTEAGAAPLPRHTVTPLAPGRYRIQLTISRETHDKLRRVQALARHTIPSGDPCEILDRALTLLLRELERRRCAETSSPRGSRVAADRTRHVPAAVKRDVWRRDDGSVRSWAGMAAAPNAGSWSFTTCSRSPQAVLPPRPIFSCDAARTTCTKRRCSSEATLLKASGKLGMSTEVEWIARASFLPA